MWRLDRPIVGTFLAAVLPGFAIPAYAGEDGGTKPGFLSEIRVGVVRHDAGVFVRREEPDVLDANAEVLFVSPPILSYVGAPRPHLGVTANFVGATSQAYLGLTWHIDVYRGVFFELGLGASVHNGNLDTWNPERKNLGCRWLYRESVSLGYWFSDRHSLSAMLDHVSHNDRCARNDGLDTLGVRWGYAF